MLRDVGDYQDILMLYLVDLFLKWGYFRQGQFHILMRPFFCNCQRTFFLIQRSFKEGPQGRARFQFYQKLAALTFALVQAVGQLTFIRPFVEDFNPQWFGESVLTLTAGAMLLVQVAETITELKLGNGTSVLIFTNIASALPTSVGAAVQQSAQSGNSNLGVYFTTAFVTTLGIVYVQEAERKIPINYASRYKTANTLAEQSYLPFKVNASGISLSTQRQGESLLDSTFS
eukprot:TRINITY_DN4108_c0_g1_i1.p1 TRINITY_DN4108_c0_g1~~TRINITY_DN4108_c0_g1_i1.p1  ORF type:complete len:230 (-),score=11.65 TRINITY_DN4108_c0_g1_i1:23-712(-)